MSPVLLLFLFNSCVINFFSLIIDPIANGSSRPLAYSLMQWICLVIMHIKFKYQISSSALGYILCLFSVVFAFFCYPLVGIFPTSMHALLKFTGASEQLKGTSFVVCPNDKCNALYKLEELFIYNTNGDILRAKCCTAMLGRCRKKVCGKELLYQKKMVLRKDSFAPHKTYEFIPPSSWLAKFFKNKTFCSLLNKVPVRKDENKMSDIRHGKLWEEFLLHPTTGEQLLNDPHNIAFILNVDWFCPFKRSNYKVGALYMSVLNLPRIERFKLKWTMLIALIPGPAEPVDNINSFIDPLVDDLLELWQGKNFVDTTGKEVQNKSLLLCISSDLPASRKITQFKSHKCVKSCDKCNFTAKREPGTKGASGKMSFVTEKRPNRPSARTRQSVEKDATEFKNAETKQKAQEISKSTGVKYSELVRLPYFDPVRMVVVDPMHSFLLGLVKNESEKHLDKDNFNKKYSMPSGKKKEFARRMKEMKVPYDVGRLPLHMTEKKTLSGLTAQQLKNYIVIYAKACLFNLIPAKAYNCFALLSEAVRIITLPCITSQEISDLEDILEEHHHSYTALCGKWSVSINYHMVLHAPQMLRDFGPASGYWCFPFERYNGVLETVSNSGRTVEQQFIHSFQNDCTDTELTTLFPSGLRAEDVPSSLTNLFHEKRSDENALTSQLYNESANSFYSSSDNLQQAIIQVEAEDAVHNWPVLMHSPQKKNVQVTLTFRNQLFTYFKNIYEHLDIVHARIHKYGRCKVNGIMFTSLFNTTDKGNVVKAYFPVSDSDGDISQLYGKVLFFFNSRVYYKGNDGNSLNKMHNLAYVNWFEYHSLDVTRNEKMTGMLQVSSKILDNFEPIINVRRLVSRCVLSSIEPKATSRFVIELPFSSSQAH